MAGILIVIVALTLSGVCFKLIERRRKLNHKNSQFANSTSSMDDVNKEFDDDKFDADNMTPLLIIQDDQLVLEKELGAGAFGRVFFGYYEPRNFKMDEDDEKEKKKCKCSNGFFT